jgi:hypothetical protein
VNNLNNPALLTPSIVLDATGTWRMRATFNGVESADARFAVRLLKTNVRVPGFGERGAFNEGGNTEGWHPSLEEMMRNQDNLHYTKTTVWNCGNRSHNSVTPLVVGQFKFDPTIFNADPSKLLFTIRGIGANAKVALSTHLVLHNLDDDEEVTDLNFTSDVVAELTTAAAVSNGVGAIKLGPRIYEIRMFVDSPVASDDALNLGEAEIELRTLV